jgi:hypothetical protein
MRRRQRPVASAVRAGPSMKGDRLEFSARCRRRNASAGALQQIHTEAARMKTRCRARRWGGDAPGTGLGLSARRPGDSSGAREVYGVRLFGGGRIGRIERGENAVDVSTSRRRGLALDCPQVATALRPAAPPFPPGA